MTYPLLNASTPGALLAYANTVTSSFWGIGIITAIYFAFLLFQLVGGVDFGKAALGAGWVSFIPATIFLALGLLSGPQYAIVVSIFVLSIVFAWYATSN
jgi:hypothetical protein